jgi:hypothetical protein
MRISTTPIFPELDDEFFVTAKHPARFLTFADLSADPWNVMRRLLPAVAITELDESEP